MAQLVTVHADFVRAHMQPLLSFLIDLTNVHFDKGLTRLEVAPDVVTTGVRLRLDNDFHRTVSAVAGVHGSLRLGPFALLLLLVVGRRVRLLQFGHLNQVRNSYASHCC